jgi:hypothetical protein
MAWYKYKHYVNQYTGLDDIYDALYKPGEVPPHSGIYRCIECGREIVAEQSGKLPPRNHHKHTAQQGVVQWRLAVYARHEPADAT